MPRKLTRRRFLRGAAAAGAAAAGASIAGVRAPWEDSGLPRPSGLGNGSGLPSAGIDLGPTLQAGGDYTRSDVRELVARSGATWIRFWAQWRFIQPTPAPLGDPAAPAPPGTFLAALDANIAAARARGMQVLLTAWTLPTEDDGPGWVPGLTGARASARSNFAFRFPADSGPATPWARWIAWLLDRYGRPADGRPWVDALEICNEPNLQMWPQRAEDGRLLSAPLTATMMSTAQALARARPNLHAVLAAPAVWDGTASSAKRTSIDVFVPELLAALSRAGVSRTGFTWSQHSYGDQGHLRLALPDGTSDAREEVSRIQLTRRRLAASGIWRPDPELMVTEGGVLLRDAGFDRARQAEMLEGWLRGVSDGAPAGAGLRLVTNYELNTVAGWDSGLCEPYPSMRFFPSGERWRAWARERPA